MKLVSSMPLFRSAVAGLSRRGSCWLMLGFGAVFCWLGPLLTPWDEQPVILQPARAQAAWIYAWLALFTWVPFQCAVLGRRFRCDGQLEFLRAHGAGAGSLWMQISAAVMLWVVLVAMLAILVCLGPCLPGRAAEAWPWAGLVLQYAALYLLVAAPVVLITVAIATRASEVIAYAAAVCWLVAGLLGAPFLEPVVMGSDLAWVRGLWLLFPHAHLADLTPRLVFKMGPLSSGDFLATSLCLGLQGGALLFLGKCLFRTRL